MKRFIVILFLILCIGMLGYMIIVNTVFNKNEEIISEYIPEVEITDDELRKTIVTLYFENIEDNALSTEARLIDSKELLREPYVALIGMLLEGPKDTKLKSVIPEDTKVLGATLSGKCVIVDLSKEFIEHAPEDINEKSNMIYTIVNTLTELKEVESVKFLIEGEETSGFEDNAINLKYEYVRKS